jgi:hypothetical protein
MYTILLAYYVFFVMIAALYGWLMRECTSVWPGMSLALAMRSPLA